MIHSLRKLLSLLAIAMPGLLLVHDAFGAITCRNNTTGARSCTTSTTCPTGWTKISTSCSTRTVGGNITYLEHHGVVVKCTWEDFEGEWTSDPGDPSATPPVPMKVIHSVGVNPDGSGDPDVYAVCSGWAQGTPLPPDVDHSDAPYGWGKFWMRMEYSSESFTPCIEDPNSGIGNNCVKFTDPQNKKHGDTGSTPLLGATRSCKNLFPGTEVTYQFACAAGVNMTGYLTLVPGTAQPAGPSGSFTNCDAASVANGTCTQVWGGVPMTTTKIKGQTYSIVDSDACKAAFPAADIPNALDSNQLQPLAESQVLFYQETATEGQCDNNELPTVAGLPSAAYGRSCQSDLGPDWPLGEGFDDTLRICAPATEGSVTHYHSAAHDVEQVKLAGNVYLEYQPTLNLNCTTGDNTDSGIYKVSIPDQGSLLAVNIDTSPGPLLEGVAPKSTAIVTDSTGVRTLVLTYPTCSALSANVINKYHPTNNSSVTLTLSGKTSTTTGLGPALFDGQLTIKVNGL